MPIAGPLATPTSVDDPYAAVRGFEPHVGYRCWYATGDRLLAPVRRTYWEPGVVEAHCPHRAAIGVTDCRERGCRCGLYAIEDDCKHSYASYYFDLRHGTFTGASISNVIGAVLLFDIERDARCGFLIGRRAVLTGLRRSSPNTTIIETLAERYDAPIVDDHDALRATAENHPLARDWSTRTSFSCSA